MNLYKKDDRLIPIKNYKHWSKDERLIILGSNKGWECEYEAGVCLGGEQEPIFISRWPKKTVEKNFILDTPLSRILYA